MKSDSVTKVWEFYRDNCVGFKEPMRKELRKLDNYVASIEAENAKLRELLAEDNKELAKMWRAIDYLYSFAKPCGVDAEDMRELGIGVDA